MSRVGRGRGLSQGKNKREEIPMLTCSRRGAGSVVNSTLVLIRVEAEGGE